MGDHPTDAVERRKAVKPGCSRLSDEEEAWYRHDVVSESIGYIKNSLSRRKSATLSGSPSGSLLGVEEDAWARPDE